MNFLIIKKPFFLVAINILIQTTPALGSLITVGFEGSVRFAEQGLGSQFNIGESIVGYYAYETTNPSNVLDNDIDIARYHVLREFQISIGDLSWSSIDDGYIQVRDRPASDPNFPLEERYSVVQRVFEVDNGGRDDLYITILHSDTIAGRDELDGIGLPNFVPFDATDYSIRMLFGIPGDFLQLDADIDSIAVIPEPSVIHLLILALLVMISRKGLIRRWRT